MIVLWMLFIVLYIIPVFIGIDLLRAMILCGREIDDRVVLLDAIKFLLVTFIPILNVVIVYSFLDDCVEGNYEAELISKYSIFCKILYTKL